MGLRKIVGGAWNRFIWLRIRIGGQFLLTLYTEPPSSIKVEKYLD